MMMLSARAQRLFAEALELTVEERAELSDQLAQSLPLAPDWLDELDHRADEVESGAVAPVPGGEAHARVRAGLDALMRR